MAGYEVAYAWGYGGQFIILAPDIELVVVATSSSTPDNSRRLLLPSFNYLFLKVINDGQLQVTFPYRHIFLWFGFSENQKIAIIFRILLKH